MTHWFFTRQVMREAALPTPLRRRAGKSILGSDDDALPSGVLVATASELLDPSRSQLPEWWRSSETRYLVLADIPEQALPRLVSALDVRRPEYRLHVTRDPSAVSRFVLAQFRDTPYEGIVDAYVLGSTLVLLLGDFSIREFPLSEVKDLQELKPEQVGAFEIDDDGSFLYWPSKDLHLGVSQLLQVVDPTYLADIEIRRYAGSGAAGETLSQLREQRGLRQTDIPDLSDRQVRRIEQGISRLKVDSAEKFASAFGMSLTELLEAIGRAVSDRHRSADRECSPESIRTSEVCT